MQQERDKILKGLSEGNQNYSCTQINKLTEDSRDSSLSDKKYHRILHITVKIMFMMMMTRYVWKSPTLSKMNITALILSSIMLVGYEHSPVVITDW